MEELNKQMVAQIDLMENAVYRVIDGQIKKVTTPGIGFGKQIITWQNGKPQHCEISFTEK
ncbi:DUF3954 domain-containing protein [Heyndrickxia coagulans]|uniref:DUF3954 domain-containing protein n=1 Tax=Heyndrickxia coagulans TaxID=1398 RepID=UPI0008F86FF1|nr:DUF3954 domain-containing protein [Heyndrickxia coagulans]APB37962.1 hypothetical protein BIZ35_15155 [Heyndrickxia coagulans]MED4936274.1 DUF3954 domain-containing protein [Heyndrickxia coagulans]